MQYKAASQPEISAKRNENKNEDTARTKRTATIRDVAAKAGVSISIVSFVLNNTPGRTIPAATKERVLSAVSELGYMPNASARGMRMRKSMSVGIVSFWDISSHVFNEILVGISSIAYKNSYTLLFCNLSRYENEFNYVELYRQQKIDGIIFISPHVFRYGFDEEKHVSMIKKESIPAVIINAYTQDPEISCIYMDFFGSSFMAAEYLYKAGHREIWYMSPPPDELTQYQGLKRLEGYRSSALKYGFTAVEFDVSGISEAVSHIKAGKGPHGIVANKCESAHIFLKALSDAGVKVPDNVSVIAGNEETYAPFLTPPLTTVKLPLKEMGMKSAEALLKQIGGDIFKLRLTLENKIIVRESTSDIIH